MIRTPLIYPLRLVYREQELKKKKGNSYTENKQGI